MEILEITLNNLCVTSVGDDSSNHVHKALIIKQKINKLDQNKIKNLCPPKDKQKHKVNHRLERKYLQKKSNHKHGGNFFKSIRKRRAAQFFKWSKIQNVLQKKRL